MIEPSLLLGAFLQKALLLLNIRRDVLNEREMPIYTTIVALSALLLMASACKYITTAENSPRVAQGGTLLAIKTCAGMILALLEMWKVGYNLSTPQLTSAIDSPLMLQDLTTFLPAITAICLAVTINREHIYARQSSTRVTIYLIFSLVVDALHIFAGNPTVESHSGVLHQLILVIILLKLTIVTLQEQPKTTIATASKQYSLEKQEFVGPLSRTFSLWIQSAFLLGFRLDIQMADLTTLGQKYSSNRLLKQFEPLWIRTNQSPATLAMLSLSSISWQLAAAAIFYAASAILKLNIPSVLGTTLKGLYQSESNLETVERLAIQTCLVYIGYGVLRSLSKHIMNNACVVLRSTLMSALIQKNIDLCTEEARDTEITTLSVDIDNIIETVCQLHEFFIDIPTLFYGFYLMYEISGRAIVAYLACKLLWSFVTAWAASASDEAAVIWNKRTHARVSFLSKALDKLKETRMIGAETTTIDSARQLRSQEVDAYKRFHKISLIVKSLLPWEVYFTTGTLIFGCLYLNIWPGGLESPLLFPTLALDDLLFFPSMGIIQMYPQILKLLAHFERVHRFLTQEGHHDHRIIRNFTDGQKFTPEELALPIEDPVHDRNRCIAFYDVSVVDIAGRGKIFEHLQMEIHAGTLTVVMGPVGSGKSTLLKTLVGETKIASGWLHVATKRMAYCGQTIWLPNASIRDVVIGEESFDQERYSEALHVCCLDKENLSIANSETIGSNGSKLSGGQKQRLALARAIYSTTQIVIVDDVLSRLDSPTASIVFQRVFSRGGLFKKQQRTVVFATHTVDWMEAADHIIEIDTVGNVTSQNDPQAMATLVEHAQYTAPLEPSISAEPTFESQDQEAWEVAVNEERYNVDYPIRATDWKLYQFLFQSLSQNQLIFYCSGAGAVAIMELFIQPYFWGWIERDPTNKSYVSGIFAIGFVGIAVNATVFWLAHFQVIPEVSGKMHSLFLDAVMKAKLPYLTSTSKGALLARFAQDMTSLGHEVPFAIFRFIYSLSLLASHIAFILLAGTHTTTTLLLLGSVLYAIQYFYVRAARQLRLLDVEAKAVLHTKINETISGVEHIRSFGWRSATINQSLALLDRAQIASYYMSASREWLTTVLQLCSALLAGSLVFFTVTEVTSVPRLGMALLGILHLTWTHEQTVDRWGALQSSLCIVRRVKAFMEETPMETDDEIDSEISIPESWPSTGAVEFQGVSATYGLASDSRMVLENVSFSVEHGQTAVIAGRTGSGKSSLFLTALHCLEHVGTVLIDEVDIKNIPRERLRSCITTIPQDGFELSNGTVCDNLLPCDVTSKQHAMATDKEIKNVLEAVGLLDCIELHGGCNANLSAMHLSSGQLQLLNIARAILHHRITGSKLILMDEVTSSLDAEMDDIIQDVMLACFTNCTRLVISHKGLGLLDYDIRLTLRNGAVVHRKELSELALPGTPDELILESSRRVESAPASLSGAPTSCPRQIVGRRSSRSIALLDDQMSKVTAFKDGQKIQSIASAVSKLEVTFEIGPNRKLTREGLRRLHSRATAKSSSSSSSEDAEQISMELKDALARGEKKKDESCTSMDNALGDSYAVEKGPHLSQSSVKQDHLLESSITTKILETNNLPEISLPEMSKLSSPNKLPETDRQPEKGKLPEILVTVSDATCHITTTPPEKKMPKTTYVSRQAFSKRNSRRDGFLNPANRTQSEVFTPDPGEGPSSRLFEGSSPAHENTQSRSISPPRSKPSSYYPSSLDIIRRAFTSTPVDTDSEGLGYYDLLQHSSDYKRSAPPPPPSSETYNRNGEFRKRLHRMKQAGRGPASMHAVFRSPRLSPKSSEIAMRRDYKKMGKPWPPRARALADSPTFWTTIVKGLSDDGRAPSLDSKDGEMTNRTVLSTRVDLINDMLTNKYGPSTHCQIQLQKLADGEPVEGPGHDRVMEVLVRNSPYSSRGRIQQFSGRWWQQ